MAKGIIGSAADAATAVAKTALGAAATAAATVIIENVARSIAKKNGKAMPPPTSDTPMPVVEDAVRQLLSAPPKTGKRSQRTAAPHPKAKIKPALSTKKGRALKKQEAKTVRSAGRKPRKKR